MFFANGQTFTAQNIIIEGTLTLDGGGLYTFDNCQIIMGEYATIHTVNGTDLTLNATHIRECDLLHMGVRVDHPQSRFRMLNGSLIEGGYFGVRLQNAWFEIDGSSFDRNYLHLWVDAYDGLNNPQPVFTNTSFVSSADMPMPMPTGWRTHTAITMRRVTGMTMGPNVSVDQCARGAMLDRSPITVRQCRFDNAFVQNTGGTNYGVPNSGVGIHAINCNAGPFIDDSDFNNNYYGQYLQSNEGPTVIRSRFNDNLIGIQLLRNHKAFISKTNRFNNHFIGISSSRDRFATISENLFDQNHVGVLSFFDQAQHIHHNQINFDQTDMPEWSGFGVWVSNASGGLQGNQFQYSTAIEENEMNGIRMGIEVRSSNFPIVEGNQINVAYHDQDPGIFSSWGIHLDRCTKAIISDNTVTGAVTDTWAWWDTGIRTDNCALIRMVCNTTENLHVGIINSGMALSTYMFNNTMQGYHHRGLIQNHGLLGQQGSATAPTDHQWVGTFQESHTQRIYDGNDPNPPASLPFYVRANSGGTDYNPTGFTAVSSPVDLFQYRINLTPANTGAVSPYGCPVDWRNAAALADVVNDSIKWHGPDSLEQRALARLEVFRAINADSTLQADATLLAFRDSFATTDLGMFENYNAKLDVQMPDSVAHAVARKLTTIHGTTMVAKHWGTVLQLAYAKWADQDSTTVLSAADSTTLYAIATLCPYTDGPAVSLARTMVFSPTKEYFSLMHKCETPEFAPPAERHGQDQDTGTASSVRLYPNPTTGRVSIEFFGGSPEANCSLTISGTDGKTVFATKVQKPRQEFDLKLTPGMYLYEVRCNDGLVDKGKLVISAH